MVHPPNNEFKELVRQRTDLVALIGESVGLQSLRGGQEYTGICPFHDDHRPSMRVYPDRQTYKCWACQAGGDCFTFVMQKERVEFREALELLAQRAGLELPKFATSAQERGEPVSKPKLYELLNWAEKEFQSALWDASNSEALQYLESRGFTHETIRKFRLGFHPADWRWIQNRSRGLWTLEQLHAARLIGESAENKGYYDYFVDRVLFPIHDSQGRCVAFGGRVLPGRDAETAKYWNSPESILFSKSRLIYGLDMAREMLVKAGMAVVVEGYTDCIMAHQCGLSYVVGTLGTALTESHVTNLGRFVRRVVLLFDGDRAGRDAAEKALPKFLAQSVDLRILTIPGNEDPAEWLLKNGTEAFEQELRRAPELWDYKFQRVVERYGLTSLDSCHRVLEEMLTLLSQKPNESSASMREDLLIARLSQRLGLEEVTIRTRLTEMRKRGAHQTTPSKINQSLQKSGSENREGGNTTVAEFDQNSLIRLMERPTTDEKLESELFQILASNPESLKSIRDSLDLEMIQSPPIRRLLGIWFASEEQFSFQEFLGIIPDEGLKQLAINLDASNRNRTYHTSNLGSILTQILLSLGNRRQNSKRGEASPKDLLKQASEKGAAKLEFDRQLRETPR